MTEEKKYMPEPWVKPVMEVLHLERPSWTLLVEGTTYYIDVRCSVAGHSHCLLLKLTRREVRTFLKAGRAYLDYMASQVQAFPQRFYNRNQPGDVQRRVADALSRLVQIQPEG